MERHDGLAPLLLLKEVRAMRLAFPNRCEKRGDVASGRDGRRELQSTRRAGAGNGAV
jgi:hypothetical protein